MPIGFMMLNLDIRLTFDSITDNIFFYYYHYVSDKISLRASKTQEIRISPYAHFMKIYANISI